MRSFSLALLGGLHLSGRLRLPERIVRVSATGGADLDLTEAEFADEALTIVKLSLIGGVELRVPRGALVTVRSLAIGRRSVEEGEGESISPAPRIRVYSFGILGGVKVKRA